MIKHFHNILFPDAFTTTIKLLFFLSPVSQESHSLTQKGRLALCAVCQSVCRVQSQTPYMLSTKTNALGDFASGRANDPPNHKAPRF